MDHIGIADAERLGRKAFRTLGAAGLFSHNFRRGSHECAGFISGFTDERMRSASRSLDESAAYHALTIREAPVDRAWAKKLSGEVTDLPNSSPLD